MLQRIIGSNGRNAAQSFRGHTLSLSDPEYRSRTYYFVTSSDTEQQEWVDAINANIKAHQVIIIVCIHFVYSLQCQIDNKHKIVSFAA